MVSARAACADRGSPPRTRGRAYSVGSDIPEDRITPAYAGKSAAALLEALGTADHPRVRGEEAAVWAPELLEHGSPPRTRGRAGRAGSAVARKRITPAYAGKRGRPAAPGSRRPDHPRVRGEEVFLQDLIRLLGGSPPRTRGRADLPTGVTLTRRITPAYAGKRPPISPNRRRSADHPRVRGEEEDEGPRHAAGGGSPPRTRGRGDPLQRHRGLRRITPAYAGKRLLTWSLATRTSDHPRVRGEESQVRRPARHSAGSPPRTRGRAHPDPGTVVCDRITPAYAGKRPTPWSGRSTGTDHPRVRGEEA